MQVFPTTEAVEVFPNNAGSITISQVSFMGEPDSVIVIPLQHINAVCRALRAAAKEAREG
ncbi:MAG: hypothetical protein WKF61_06145 [Luteimonas sp.]